MNYRHAFHAGNFADVVKHTILTRILAYLQRKEAAFRVIDTHAGIGLYDLLGSEAERTGEWQAGIAARRRWPICSRLISMRCVPRTAMDGCAIIPDRPS
jgi:23S rRNA A2030 N6-methylase RlmJ